VIEVAMVVMVDDSNIDSAIELDVAMGVLTVCIVFVEEVPEERTVKLAEVDEDVRSSHVDAVDAVGNGGNLMAAVGLDHCSILAVAAVAYSRLVMLVGSNTPPHKSAHG
jgi:hypothetical protein